MSGESKQLVDKLLAGDRLALAKAISLVENVSHQAREILEAAYPQVGRAYRIGVTGPLGVGKSTLIDEVALMMVKEGSSVGILAIDPTSPFTGGALLGDRVRMQRISSEPGVFIRSMATRGAVGGLAKCAHQVCDLLDASGKEYVVIETVGVGQSEVDIVRTVDTTVLILSPESGDGIQVMKAGLMEAADIFVVNKADRPGAFSIEEEIRLLVEMSRRTGSWRPPVVRTEAHRGVGVEELRRAIEAHRSNLAEGGQLAERRRKNLRAKLEVLVENRVKEELRGNPEWAREAGKAVERIADGELTPYSAVEDLVQGFFGGICSGGG